MSSRSCVTGTPFTTLLSTDAIACELRAQQTRFVLIDVDANLPRGLDPVEVDVLDGRICGDTGASRSAMLLTSFTSGPLTRY